MPSVSQAQHGFMGMVLAYKQSGRMPPGLSATRQKQIRKAAASMTEDQLKEYTETRSSKLPEHVGKK